MVRGLRIFFPLPFTRMVGDSSIPLLFLPANERQQERPLVGEKKVKSNELKLEIVDEDA